MISDVNYLMEIIVNFLSVPIQIGTNLTFTLFGLLVIACFVGFLGFVFKSLWEA